MDTVLYILMFACLGVVVTWYVANEAVGAGGDKGLLSILPPEMSSAVRPASYRQVERIARQKGRPVPFRAADETPRSAFREAAGPGRRYRMRDDAAFRDKGEAPRYNSGTPETPRTPRYRTLS